MRPSTPLLFAALLLCAAPLAQAQTGTPESQIYDPSYSGMTNDAAEEIRRQQRESLSDQGYITPHTVHLSIVRKPYMEADQFGLQMAVPDVVSGCHTLSPLEFESKFIDPHYLDIKVKHFRRIAPEGVADQAQCNRQNRMSTGLMVLSKNDLSTRGTREVSFSTEAASDTYTLNLSENGVTLTPQSTMVFKPVSAGGNTQGSLSFNVAESGMVALHVPMARPGDQVEGPLRQFAYSLALSPADTPESAKTAQSAPVFYFHDHTGRAAGLIGEDGYGEIGTITVTRPMDGAFGRARTNVELSVFVTRPGTNL